MFRFRPITATVFRQAFSWLLTLCSVRQVVCPLPTALKSRMTPRHRRLLVSSTKNSSISANMTRLVTLGFSASVRRRADGLPTLLILIWTLRAAAMGVVLLGVAAAATAVAVVVFLGVVIVAAWVLLLVVARIDILLGSVAALVMGGVFIVGVLMVILFDETLLTPVVVLLTL